MGAAIQKEHSAADVQLVPGGRGDFIVTVDEDELWNKRQMDNEFPEDAAILSKLPSSS